MERRWKVLVVTAVAVFMGFLDVTIVNVAFPDIVLSCVRQIGAVLGIAALVALLDAAPPGTSGFVDAPAIV